MRMLPAPVARAASTYSSSRICSTVARSMRTDGGMPAMEMASAVLNTPVPSPAEMATASSSPGMAMMTSMMRMTATSYFPPK